MSQNAMSQNAEKNYRDYLGPKKEVVSLLMVNKDGKNFHEVAEFAITSAGSMVITLECEEESGFSSARVLINKKAVSRLRKFLSE